VFLMVCCFWFVDWAFCCFFVVVEGDHQRRTGLAVLPSALLCRILAHFSLDSVDISVEVGNGRVNGQEEEGKARGEKGKEGED